jgi:hypothetical protein
MPIEADERNERSSRYDLESRRIMRIMRTYERSLARFSTVTSIAFTEHSIFLWMRSETGRRAHDESAFFPFGVSDDSMVQ